MQTQVVSLVMAAIVLSSSIGAAQELQPRILAPGVLTVIPTAEEPEETYSGPVPMVEIVEGMPDLDWMPHFDAKSNTLRERSRSIIFRRVIWNLEFSFKPMRLIEVDVPQPTGKMQRKLIWYMVYRVTNRGYALRPKGAKDPWNHELFSIEEVNYAKRRFFPHFVLTSHEYSKEYLDRVIPAAQQPIQEREKPGAKLHNSVEITKIQIPLSDDRAEHSVWGVVTWEDIDPRIDYFSVYVSGLTNAFRFEDPPGAFQPGDPPGTGRTFTSKTLQLNFWRPGDDIFEHEQEFRFGIPGDAESLARQRTLEKYGIERRLDYLWVYR